MGRGGTLAIRHMAGWPTESSLLTLTGSISISITVGVIFGDSFSSKTSRLNPTEGLCYE